jgi:hypothetical protein
VYQVGDKKEVISVISELSRMSSVHRKLKYPYRCPLSETRRSGQKKEVQGKGRPWTTFLTLNDLSHHHHNLYSFP